LIAAHGEQNRRGRQWPVRRRFTVLVALIACAGAAWIHQRHYDFEHDDAYISYRYSANWAAGAGPVFNLGERVEGYTNFLHVLVLRQCQALGLDPVRCARLLGTLAHLALIGLCFAFALTRLRRTAWQALGASTLVATHAALAVWARSGLETVPFAFLVLAATYAFVGESGGRHLVSGALFGLVALSRADGFVLAACTIAFLIVRTRSVRGAMSFLTALAVVFVPHLLWRLSYYGYPLPNSYYLKTGGDYFQQIRGLFYAYNFVEPFGGIALFCLPLLLIARRDRARDATRLYLWTLIVGWSGYTIWAGGDHMPVARFFVPVVPLLALLWMETAVEFAALWQGRSRVAAVAGVGVMLVAIVSGIGPTLNQRRLPASYAISHRTLVHQWSMAGRWLRAHYPPQTLMATEPAGAVAYLSGLRIVDMLGVNDLHIAHLPVAGMGRGTAGHEKRDLEYVLSREPDLFFRGVRDTPAQDSGRGGDRRNTIPLTQCAARPGTRGRCIRSGHDGIALCLDRRTHALRPVALRAP
jgi:hypothetical protein